MNQIAENLDMQELIHQIKDQLQLYPTVNCEQRIALAMQQYPHSPIPHNLMGIVLWKRNEPLRAMQHFRAAAALAPTYIPARCNLELCTSLNSSGSFAYEEQDCSLPQPVNPWKVVWDEKGVGQLVRRKRQ